MKTEIQFSVNAATAPRNIDDKVAGYAAAKLGISPAEIIRCEIAGKSIDSRKKSPLLVYRLIVELPDHFCSKYPEYSPKSRAAVAPEHCWKNPDRPIIVGTGPAGLFAALYLCSAGARPLVIDRGYPVEIRAKKHASFLKTRELDPESNLLIGEGGAGTFSDGKLYTGTKSIYARMVIDELISCGAPEEIGYLSRPHVGSDRLKLAIPELRRKIERLGGTFLFQSHVVDILERGNICCGVKLADGSCIESSAGVILACGLGGRELIRTLISRGVGHSVKAFQLGCRIEHPQDFIDLTQYKISRPESLGAAEYHIVSRPQNAPGVSSFCMCPGGKIVNASAWKNSGITNGMSEYARDGRFANSCLISTVTLPENTSCDEIYDFMQSIEREQFIRGGRDYAFPCQTAEDFLRGKPTCKKLEHECETGIVPGRVDDLLPEASQKALRAALKHFERIMPGFIKYGKFIGVESCVSSPVRITRGENGQSSVGLLFPAGEGPGVAGGIISAACDGIKTAENLLKAVN